MVNCCKECDHRELGCHETCPEYNKQKKQHQELEEKIRSEKQQYKVRYYPEKTRKGY